MCGRGASFKQESHDAPPLLRPRDAAQAAGARAVIAALFVETGGAYFGLPNVDPWDEARDASRKK